jgi:hypothetical protein
MKHYLVLALAALAFAIVAPSAFATRVIFDPPPETSGISPYDGGTDCTLGVPGNGDFTPCNVSKRDTPYQVNFVDCMTLTGLAEGVRKPGWCLYMINVTGAALGKFTFEFTVPAGGSYDGNDELQCGSHPIGFASDDCQDGMHVTAGDVLDLSFFASTVGEYAIVNNKAFYLITDFKIQPHFAIVTVSVPEPDTLGLFGLGLLVLGTALGWRRRQDDAAA